MKSFIVLATFLVFVSFTFQISETCQCVPSERCNTASGINLRGPNPCENFWHICCEADDIIPDPKQQTETPWGEKCGVSYADGIPGFHITDIENTSQYGEFPWVIALLKQNEKTQIFEYYRGGSLIHPSVVLTASFGLEGLDETEIKIRAGEYDRFNTNEPYPHQDRDVKTIVRHENSNRPQYSNNIALLFLESPVDLAINVGTVLLPQQDNIPDLDTCIATGWGAITLVQRTKQAQILKRIELPIVENDRCELLLRRALNNQNFQLNDKNLCAGGKSNQDTCFGDGGSPLVCPIEGNENMFYQAGLVSWGAGCGHANVPGVYTNIASYRSWINKKIEQTNFRPINCSAVKVSPKQLGIEF